MSYTSPENYAFENEDLVGHINRARKFSNLNGMYRGKVMKTSDPDKVGYVKVLVYGIHEKFDNVDTLPSAYVMQAYGGGQNYGTFYIPPVGSTVLVAFENGDPNAPIVVGTWFGGQAGIDEHPSEVPKSLQNCQIEHVQPTATGSTTTTQEVEEIDEVYSSQDALKESYRHEPRNLITKSFKGHSIEIDDTGIGDDGEPDEDQSTEKNQGIRITTRKKNLIHFVDEDGKEAIIIRDRKNNYIQIDIENQNININVENNKNSIIHNNKNEEIYNDRNVEIHNDDNKQVDGTWNVHCNGDINIDSDTNINMTSPGVSIQATTDEVTVQADVKIKMIAPRIDLN